MDSVLSVSRLIIDANVLAWQVAHTVGQFSPHRPMQGWRQGSCLGQGLSHRGRSHSSPHVFLHSWWGQVQVHGLPHGPHGSKHLLLHLSCGQCRPHFLAHGGQGSPHAAWQRCEQTRRRLHGFWQNECEPFCLQSPHCPEHGLPQSNFSLHGTGHFTSSTDRLQGIFTLWPHERGLLTTTSQRYFEQGSPQTPWHLCLHFSRRWQGALQVALLLWKHVRYSSWSQGCLFSIRRQHFMFSHGWLQSPGHGWPQFRFRLQRSWHAILDGSSLQSIL